MRKQTYLIRKGARYHFRRRLPSEGSVDNGALTLSLHTSDPDEARRLARRLAVPWDEIAMLEGQKINRGNLTVAEQMAIFRTGLEEELAIAVRDLTAPRKFQPNDLGMSELFIAAYEAITSVRADADHVPAHVLDTVAKGWRAEDRSALEDLLEVFVRPDDVTQTRIVGALQHVGAPVCENTIHEGRASLLRGMIEAQRRAALYHHPLMRARGGAVAGLLDDDLVFEARRSQLPSVPTPSTPAVSKPLQAPAPAKGNLFFARLTGVRFSEQIDELHDDLFDDRGWQPDDGKTRHMLEAFAWLTGDKAMSDYEPSDIDAYVRRMALIPAKFRWGHLHKSGPMAEPFDLSAFPKPKASERRSDRTINSHLSKLAAAAKILKKTHWLPRQGFGNVMDFEEARKPIVQDDNDPPRMSLTLSAMTNLMCRGRKRGLAGVVATQRLAKLAKNVAAEASNFLMGRTFLDIDMKRAADLLGMDRRQAERIRDLQRGQFLGLGPAISRRPVAVEVGAAQTGGKNAGQGLMLLPETGGDELEALLHGELAQEAQANAPRVVAPKRKTVSDVEQAILHRAGQPPPPRTIHAEEAPTPPIAADTAPLEQAEADPVNGPAEVSVERIVEDLARQDGATFRSPSTLFREFLTTCRQHGVVSAHIDMREFRRLFAFALSGTGRLSPPARATIERLAEGVEEDVLAPYLAIAVAALHGRNRPDEDELARVYGSSSPGRIRRLLDHLERSNLIAVREDFGGVRTITVLGFEAARAD